MMITVVGIGQPMRADDSLGWMLVRALPDREGVSKLLVGDDVTRILDVLRPDRALIIVDAARSNTAVAGTVFRFDLRQELKSQSLRFSSHSLDPLPMIELARRLGRGLPDQLVLFAMEGADFGFGSQLSEPVKNGWPSLLQGVEDEIRDLSRA